MQLSAVFHAVTVPLFELRCERFRHTRVQACLRLTEEREARPCAGSVCGFMNVSICGGT